MRDECLFALEWVADHHIVGFDRVFECTNDCSDGTDILMDRLADLDVVHHIRNPSLRDLAPQPAGVERVLAHPALTGTRWLLHIDADEFLKVLVGGGASPIGFRPCLTPMPWPWFGASSVTAASSIGQRVGCRSSS